MKLLKPYITFLLLLIWGFCFGQQFTNYTTKDGLPSNHIYSILQDAKGYMWFLTDKGMVRHNGTSFKPFTTKNGLPSNDIWEAFTTPDGKIWYFAKSATLGYIDNDSITAFNSEYDEIINPTFSSQVDNSVYPIGPKKAYKLENNVWKVTIDNTNVDRKSDNLQIYHKTVKQLNNSFMDNGRVVTAVVGHDNQVLKILDIKVLYEEYSRRGQLNDSLYFWSGETQYGILNLNTLELKRYKFKDQIALDNVKYSRINLVNNELQLSGSGIVAKLDADFRIIKPFYFPKRIDAHFGFIDRFKNIWLATFSSGLYKLPYHKQTISYYLNDQKVDHLNIIDTTIIASIFNKGFYKFNSENKQFSSYIKEPGQYASRAKRIETKNTEYYITEKNITVKNQNSIQTIPNSLISENDESGTNKYTIIDVLEYDNSLYARAFFEIIKLNPETLIAEEVYILKGCNDFVDYNNRLVLGTTNGLKELKNKEIIDIQFSNIPFNKSVKSILKVDENTLVLGTDGFGGYLANFNKNTITPLKDSAFLTIENAIIDEGNLWLATNTGILKYELKNTNYVLAKTLNGTNGLPANNINDIAIIQNNLFVATDNGIAVLSKDQDDTSQFLDVFIDKATYNSQSIIYAKNKFEYQTNNTLGFTASAINFTENQTNFAYRYKLEPIQNTWVTTQTPVFNFNNLQPNTYTFYVEANGIIKTRSFTIQPLYYQTLWFKILMILLAIALIAYFSWALIQRVQAKKNKKLIDDKRLSDLQLQALRSQMNPHFVFNSLAAIQYYINNNETKTSEIYLVKFSQLIRNFFELSKETEIKLSQEIDLITNYLDLEKLRFKDKLDYTINIDKGLNIDTCLLPTMLLQPIIENAINHGIFNKVDSGKLTINFIFIDSKSLKIEIIDDGVGFANTQKKGVRKVKSSNVLEDRLKYLNQSGQWFISYSEEELHPHLSDKGNKSIFIIEAASK